MPDAAGNRNHKCDSNETASKEGPPPGAGWLGEEIKALRKRVEQIRREIARLRSKRSPDRLLTKEEAADLLSVSERTVDTLVADGEISSIKVRRCRRIPKQALDAYIKRRAEDNEF